VVFSAVSSTGQDGLPTVVESGSLTDLRLSADRSGQPVSLEGRTLSKAGTFFDRSRSAGQLVSGTLSKTWDFRHTGRDELVSWRAGLTANMGALLPNTVLPYTEDNEATYISIITAQ
jgi:hypothetical protein